MNGKAQKLMGLVTGVASPDGTDAADEGAAYWQVKPTLGELMADRDAAQGAAMHWEEKYWDAEEQARQLEKENGVLEEQRNQAIVEAERLQVRHLAAAPNTDPDAEPEPTPIYDQLAAEQHFELGVYEDVTEQAVAS